MVTEVPWKTNIYWLGGGRPEQPWQDLKGSPQGKMTVRGARGTQTNFGSNFFNYSLSCLYLNAMVSVCLTCSFHYLVYMLTEWINQSEGMNQNLIYLLVICQELVVKEEKSRLDTDKLWIYFFPYWVCDVTESPWQPCHRGYNYSHFTNEESETQSSVTCTVTLQVRVEPRFRPICPDS